MLSIIFKEFKVICDKDFFGLCPTDDEDVLLSKCPAMIVACENIYSMLIVKLMEFAIKNVQWLFGSTNLFTFKIH